MKRIFIIIADSLGIGAAADADRFFNGSRDDSGSNTFRSVAGAQGFSAPFLQRLGMGNIDGLKWEKVSRPAAAYGRLCEASAGKDTTTGHWELAGVITETAMPTFPAGFPGELLNRLTAEWGRGWLCNKVYSGTEVIRDYGREHIKTGSLIVYTSADSVFQIAAHEAVVPPEELYACCEAARRALCGEYAVGRVIARPFTGEFPDFTRTANRRDFSLMPTGVTLCDVISNAGMSVIGVGKISDIFAGRGITESYHTEGNTDGINRTLELAGRDFRGLCFVNLVDFDMKYGHRRDIVGYARAVEELDAGLEALCERLLPDDCVIVSADHGCDPGYSGTDHTREDVPILVYGEGIKAVNVGKRKTFADLGKTAAELLGADAAPLCGESFA